VHIWDWFVGRVGMGNWNIKDYYGVPTKHYDVSLHETGCALRTGHKVGKWLNGCLIFALEEFHIGMNLLNRSSA